MNGNPDKKNNRKKDTVPNPEALSPSEIIQYYESLKTMLRALEDNLGMQHLTEAGYSVLKNPLFVIDGGRHFIGCCYDEDTARTKDRFYHFIQSNIPDRRVSERGLKYFQKNQLGTRLSLPSDLIELYDENLSCTSLHASLFVGGISVGNVWMPCLETEIDEWKRKLFAEFVALATQEMHKSETLHNNISEYETLLFNDLLSATYIDPIMIDRCRKAFKIPPDAQLYIASTPVFTDEDTSVLLLRCAEFKQIFPKQQITIFKKRLIALFSLAPAQTLSSLIDVLEDYTIRSKNILGISNRFENLNRVQVAYRQAQSAARLGNHVAPKENIHLFENLTMFELMTAYRKENILSDLLSAEIREIIDNDRDNGTDYEKTLRAYFKYQGNKEKICRELHIHQNTLLYRMNRLRDHFHFNLKDGDAVIRYHFSLYIKKFLDNIDTFESDREI